MLKDIFYNGNETLTHNKLFNFVVSNRGAGKTYWSKQWAIKDFLKNGNQFVYLRRFKEEIKELKKDNTFFKDIIKNEEFPNVEFEIKQDLIYINKEVAGRFMCLSTTILKKSTPLPYVNKIIFDEFIIDKSYYHYLQDEVMKFLEFYETVTRLRWNFEEDREDSYVKVFFMSNAITITNPYFLYFRINNPNTNKRYHHYKFGSTEDILVEFPQNKEFINLKKKTRFGQMMSGSEYEKYAIDNSFLRDTNTFVKKKSSKARHYFSLKYNERLYHVWLDDGEGVHYISKDFDPYQNNIYTLTQKDHSPNTLLINKGKKDWRIKELIENYKTANVFFEDMNLKNIFYEIIRLFLM